MSRNPLLTDEENDLLAGASDTEALTKIAAGDDEPVDEPASEPAAEPAAEPVSQEEPDREVPAVFTPQFRADEPPAESVMDDLRKQGIDLRKRWSNGEIDDEEYNAQAIKLDAEREAAMEAKITARVTSRMSEQTAKQGFEFQRDAFLKIAQRVDGVPYLTNDIVRLAFNTELAKAGQAAIDAGNTDISAEELFTQADKAVRASFAAIGANFGRQSAAPAAINPSATTASKQPRTPLQTLAGLPSADRTMTDTNSDTFARFAGLEGDDLEIAVAKTSKDDRRKMLERAN